MPEQLRQVLRSCTDAVSELFHREQEFGDWPGEEQATDEMWRVGHPLVKRLKFNRTEESKAGADWLWWFVSEERSFGVLIQAKILRRENRSWTIGFEHVVGNRQQDEILRETAGELKIPYAYAVYFGPPDCRSDVPQAVHARGTERDRSMSVALLEGLVYWEHVRRYFGQGRPRRERVDDAYQSSVPLLALAAETAWSDWNEVLVAYPEHLETWRTLHQDAQTSGAGAVAAAMVRYLVAQRRRDFTGTSQALMPSTMPDVVFEQLPDDRGHFGVPYLPYLLNSYTRQPPDYVEEALAGGHVTGLPDSIAGLVVFDERRRRTRNDQWPFNIRF